MKQFKARVSLLTEIKLKENFGRFKIDDRERNGVGLIVLELRTQEVEPFTKVILEGDVFD